jgi:two-component system, OmpR family, sensor histidine kinase VanS
MKKSIRSRLFMSIILLLLFFIFLLWILNNQYLSEYYLKQKKTSLINNAKNINRIITENTDDLLLDLDITANITGSNIEIRNANNIIIFATARRPGHMERDINPRPNPPKPKNDINKYTVGNYTFETQQDSQLKIGFLALVTKLSNGYILAIRVPLISIDESVRIANSFIIFTGIIILILGSLWAYLFARSFTKPILELNYITRKIAKLDFEEKCIVSGDDELSQLGESINHLSSELSFAITDLNIKNKRLEEDIDKERKIDEMRKEFISSVSHELRTPISVIQGYAEGLISNVAESQEDRQFYCDVIMKEAGKMNKLVKDLLDISQIESGYFKLEKTEFDLSSLLQYVIGKNKNIFIEKKVSLEFENQGELMVYGDMLRIEQVLTNLLSNAMNHVDGEKIIKIELKTINEKIRVSLYNSGKHIPEESLLKIWQSFYKVDKARTRAYGGYGLGLSIVKAIQELHNNLYGVENLENGVSFWFDIDTWRENKK